MSTGKKIVLWVGALILVLLIVGWFVTRGDRAELSVEAVTGTDPVLTEPEPETIPTVNIAEPVGWAEGETPDAAAGLEVVRFAEGLDHPRVIHTLPNGDVLVALTGSPGFKPEGAEDGGIFKAIRGFIEGILFSKAGADSGSANEIMLLRDTDGDGVADQRGVIVDDLSSPSGIAWRDGTLYVANHDALLAFPYELGASRVGGEPRKLMDLPPGGGHWMRNIELSEDGTKIYVAVGSVSNIGENGMEVEEGRAAIWEYDLEQNRQRLFGAGLRNPNGLDFSPWSGELWTTVNERDMLGSDLVPDYLTNVPVGAQYGWPWVYYGDTFDRRVESNPPQFLTEYTRYPEYALGPHVAALGFRFTDEGARLGERFGSGAVIARHGSWNRKPASGYDVVYVDFDERGNPQGKPQPVLTGFLAGDGETRGRPTWVEWAEDGALLVSDDTAGIIWRVVDPNAEPAAAIERLESRPLPPQRELSGEARATFQDDYVRE
ncbi:PQQ-dependent sugar dehydrogenase [Qipengyuania atrilutea]|uniref:Sorbosone dehydrogenase family protein n=1 Tax=Qipengyuania atrilutea TaxID=2744473 RepID=A0A850H2M3_9SPHN|nr:sorbosone dehydrogenase family protein [Actirhodobacter atriluteus]NVD44442.1 sorbosone dehydrogenase family protein [Actirhodobacter atriluteus]